MILTLGYVSANSIAQMSVPVPTSSTFCDALEIGAKRAFYPGAHKICDAKDQGDLALVHRLGIHTGDLCTRDDVRPCSLR